MKKNVFTRCELNLARCAIMLAMAMHAMCVFALSKATVFPLTANRCNQEGYIILWSDCTIWHDVEIFVVISSNHSTSACQLQPEAYVVVVVTS
jgi:hypothetical protein